MRIFIAKSDLPFGIKAGFEYYTEDNINFFNSKNNSKCPYNCINEKKFFTEQPGKLYDVSKKIIFHIIELPKKWRTSNTNHNTSIFSNSEFYINRYLQYDPKYGWNIEVKDVNSDKIINTWEICLQKCEVYFFINSDGDIHSMTRGKNPKRDEWTEKTNNQFPTKEDAQKCKDNFNYKLNFTDSFLFELAKRGDINEITRYLEDVPPVSFLAVLNALFLEQQ